MTRSVRIAAVLAIALVTGSIAWFGFNAHAWAAAALGGAMLGALDAAKRGAIGRTIIGALFAAAGVALIAWFVDAVLGAAWPEVKRFARSGTFLFSLVAIVGAWDLILRSGASAPRPRV